MKTLLLFSLFLIPLVNVQSQNTKLIWAPIGAIWEYRVGGLSSNHTCIITVLKDTIIDGVRAKKILNACTFSSANTNRYPEFYFIYQKSPDVIEYLINNHFSTLYDFSTKAGETILVKIKNNLDSIHDPCKDSIKLIKSLNTSQSIGGESLKFYNYNITQDIVNCGMSIGSNVFQIFGPLNGFLFPTYQVLESSFQLTR